MIKSNNSSNIKLNSSTLQVGIVAGLVATVATLTVATSLYRRSTSSRRQSSSSSKEEEETTAVTSPTTTDVPDEVLECPYLEELTLGIQLAKRAGSNMIEYLNSKGTSTESLFDLGIETKSGKADFCTSVDIENEKLIIEGIKEKYPTHSLIGEESVGTGGIPPLTDNPTWIIDPIDGTTNFSSGIHSMTCVSIAYCINKCPVVGVIYAPGTQELYVGVKGYGAYRNSIRIQQTSDTSTKSLQDAVICVEFGYSRDTTNVTTIMNGLQKVIESGCPRAIRQFGSGCLDLCMVASGRIDIVYAGLANEGWKPWDYAAGLVICEEAGCIMEAIDQDNDEEGFDLYSTSVICGVSRELVDELRLILSFF